MLHRGFSIVSISFNFFRPTATKVPNMPEISKCTDSDEFKLLKGLINEDVTVEEAVQWVIAATMDRLEGYGSGGTIDEADAITFQALLELAMQIDPSQYGPLLAFLKEMKMYNAVDSTTGLVLKAQDGSWVWSHLPTLTVCVRQICADFEREGINCKLPVFAVPRAMLIHIPRSMRPRYGTRATDQMGKAQHISCQSYSSGRRELRIFLTGADN
jgi:hypothetical protein